MCCGGSCYDSRSKEDDGEQPSLSALLKAGLSPSTQWAFLQLGLPGGLMMAADASSFDVTTAMAGALGKHRSSTSFSPALLGQSRV